MEKPTGCRLNRTRCIS